MVALPLLTLRGLTIRMLINTSQLYKTSVIIALLMYCIQLFSSQNTASQNIDLASGASQKLVLLTAHNTRLGHSKSVSHRATPTPAVTPCHENRMDISARPHANQNSGEYNNVTPSSQNIEKSAEKSTEENTKEGTKLMSSCCDTDCTMTACTMTACHSLPAMFFTIMPTAIAAVYSHTIGPTVHYTPYITSSLYRPPIAVHQ